VNPAANITIQHVADAAGVSTGTVSRVLNDRAGVKAKTRDTVLATIQKLNYRPNQTARELSKQATRIGLHISGVPKLTRFYMLFWRKLVEKLGADGYRLEEINTFSDASLQSLDGLILFGAHDDDPRIHFLKTKDIPFVLIGHGQDIRWVAPDDIGGAGQAVGHLLRLGHREIVKLTGKLDFQGAQDRLSGYKQALEDAGLSFQRDLLLEGNFSALEAYRAVRKAREAGLKFTAIFAASDEMALGAIAALEDLGLNVPLDISVVGFDDLPTLGDRLTTVRQDISEIVTTAVSLLKQGLAKEPVCHKLVETRLIVRSTTARKRG